MWFCAWIYVSVGQGVRLIRHRACGDGFWLCRCLCQAYSGMFHAPGWIHLALYWDCLIQCFIVLSSFTHAFGALQNTSSCFCGMGKWEQNLAFGGKVRVEGRCLWDLLCCRETRDLGEMWPSLPPTALPAPRGGFIGVPLVELTQQWGQSCPPPSKTALPNLTGLFSFPFSSI